jgi:hypothetical protein
VDDAYQTFFMEHRVETDKRQSALNTIHVVEDNPEQNSEVQEQNVAAFRPQP